jgi:tetratricopeptide (TPR) repeat protein
MKPLLFFLIPIITMAQTSFEKAKLNFDTQKATQQLEKCDQTLKAAPNNLVALEKAGDYAGQLMLWDNAIEYYQKLKLIKPNVANYHYKYGGALGMKALEVNKFKALGMISDIKASFETAIALDPKHIDSHWALVQLYIKLPSIVGGSERKAIEYSNKLANIDLTEGYLSRAYIEEYFDRYTNAEKYYLKAIDTSKSKHAYLSLANLYKNKMKQTQKANVIMQEYRKNI